ncbi:MAG: hypothetical protein H8E46_02635 [FCB group bacterium]|nr:hypothetical protein [FCB group bacterium]
MNPNLDLDKIEQKSVSAYFISGWWDIYAGLLLVWFGLTTEDFRLGIAPLVLDAVYLFLAIIFFLVWKYSVLPRSGYVKLRYFGFHGSFKQLKGMLIYGGLYFLLFTTALFIIKNNPVWLEIFRKEPAQTLLAGFSLLILSLIYYRFMGQSRILLYLAFAFLAMISADISFHLTQNVHAKILVYILLGAVLTFIGIVRFTKFLKRNPQLDSEGTNAP